MNPVALSAASFVFGMNFSLMNVHIHDDQTCVQTPSIDHKGEVFLPKYSDPSVRARVKAQLTLMHQSGFSTVRTLLLFSDHPSEDKDWFDLNSPASQASKAVEIYLQDVADAGFASAELGFGPQGYVNPACRREQWGDCFDNGTVNRSVRFITSVRQGIQKPPQFHLSIDLTNEACVTKGMTDRLSANFNQYLAPLIDTYVHQFLHDETTVSCSIERFAGAKPEIDRLYAAAGAAPSFYEIHAYQNASVNIAGIVAQIKAALSGSPIPITIGETNYGDPSYFRSLLDDLQAVELKPNAVIFWPLRNFTTHCGADVPPPYTLSGALGN